MPIKCFWAQMIHIPRISQKNSMMWLTYLCLLIFLDLYFLLKAGAELIQFHIKVSQFIRLTQDMFHKNLDSRWHRTLCDLLGQGWGHKAHTFINMFRDYMTVYTTGKEALKYRFLSLTQGGWNQTLVQSAELNSQMCISWNNQPHYHYLANTFIYFLICISLTSDSILHL